MNARAVREPLLTLLVGVGLGFALSRIGFSSWDEVHAMFTFSDLRMFLTFCGSVAVLLVMWRVLAKVAPRFASFRPRMIHKGSVLGGVLFGAGWAISGACPSIALVQLGEGQLGALFTLLGIFAGNALYGFAQGRYLHWDTGSCRDD